MSGKPEDRNFPKPNPKEPFVDFEPDESLLRRPRVSGSSNREGGYDIHPHPGDHGEAQKHGSPWKADYDGESG